jgi:hypothetical protein
VTILLNWPPLLCASVHFDRSPRTALAAKTDGKFIFMSTPVENCLIEKIT